MAQITVRLTDDLFGKVEAARGLVPRERWVRELLKAAVGEPSEVHVAPTSVPVQVPRDRAAMFREMTERKR